ncbi:MAG: hypothetical protein F9K16_08120 [Thermoanaerobaculia bacterium]|jgi:hypothetical protein|nr:MAG: hypothetical protein F9K16_08120 [Thermoanaerobaculia bacterium]MBZ0102848.1 hypothetical protein [Thermoanaerobaculia bacterium]
MASERRHLIGAAAAATAVLAGVVAALLHLGSPAERRLRRLDEERVQRLRHLESSIDLHLRSEKVLPADLKSLARLPWAGQVTFDPDSHEPFGYEVLGDRSYRLCAEFALPTPPPPPDREADFWAHPEGKHCYEFEVKPDEDEPWRRSAESPSEAGSGQAEESSPPGGKEPAEPAD